MSNFLPPWSLRFSQDTSDDGFSGRVRFTPLSKRGCRCSLGRPLAKVYNSCARLRTLADSTSPKRVSKPTMARRTQMHPMPNPAENRAATQGSSPPGNVNFFRKPFPSRPPAPHRPQKIEQSHCAITARDSQARHSQVPRRHSQVPIRRQVPRQISGVAG